MFFSFCTNVLQLLFPFFSASFSLSFPFFASYMHNCYLQ